MANCIPVFASAGVAPLGSHKPFSTDVDLDGELDCLSTLRFPILDNLDLRIETDLLTIESRRLQFWFDTQWRQFVTL